MKSKWLIEERIKYEEDAKVIQTLKWVLESPECPLCNHPQRKELETQIFMGNMTPAYLDTTNGWEDGTTETHMQGHMTYDPKEAKEVEATRKEAISTLDMAENVFSRIERWLDEWEEQKDAEGINAGLVHVPNHPYTCFKESLVDLPQTEYFSKNQISLPCGWWLSKDDINIIAQSLLSKL